MQTRYGIFLRPDPITCLAITTITAAVRAQYGLVSAGAFPPHATLVGSLPVGDDEASRQEALGHITAGLDDLCAQTRSFPVENSGIRLDSAVVYDIHQWDGAPNEELVELADATAAIVRPWLVDTPPDQLAADVHPRDDWRGHLSLASHELALRPDLREEVFDFVTRLAVEVPMAFDAEVLALYEFTSGWTGEWWRDLGWRHLRSWRLEP